MLFNVKLCIHASLIDCWVVYQITTIVRTLHFLTTSCSACARKVRDLLFVLLCTIYTVLVRVGLSNAQRRDLFFLFILFLPWDSDLSPTTGLLLAERWLEYGIFSETNAHLSGFVQISVTLKEVRGFRDMAEKVALSHPTGTLSVNRAI